MGHEVPDERTGAGAALEVAEGVIIVDGDVVRVWARLHKLPGQRGSL